MVQNIAQDRQRPNKLEFLDMKTMILGFGELYFNISRCEVVISKFEALHEVYERTLLITLASVVVEDT